MKDNWECHIKKTINGYYVETSSIEGHKEFVIEIPEILDDKNGTKSEQIAFRNLFNELRDYFAVFNDKHTNQYLDIKVSNTEDDE